MTQYAFYVDSSVCTGCKTCQVACQDKNDLDADMIWRFVHQYGGGSWIDRGNGLFVPDGVFRYFVPMSCNHCANPACVEVCPTGAMQKDENTGIVWSDHEVCIGCESCAGACPYGAPRLDSGKGYTVKCDLCKDQLAEGGEPECVASCNQRALAFGTLDDLNVKYPGCTCEVEPLPIASTTPSILINPHPKAQKSGKGTGFVLNMDTEL